ncbi:hypothetical protein quinque_016334 [Culex quinquefasciatus]
MRKSWLNFASSPPFFPGCPGFDPEGIALRWTAVWNFRLASLNQAAKSITEFSIVGADSALLVRSANLLHPVRRHDERGAIWNGTAFLSVDGTISGGRCRYERRYSVPSIPVPIDSKPECQSIMSVRSSDRFRQQVVEALRRAKFKFHSRRKIFIWKKWGFTKYDRDQHQVYWDEVCLVSDGCGVKFFNDHGPLKKREAYERARLA